MKKLLSLSTIAITALFVLSGCTSTASNITVESASKVDVKNVCSVEGNGIKTVLATATAYNTVAIKNGLEFKRLGMKTSQYISGASKALATGAKTVDIVDKKKKKTGSVSTEYAAWRACSFSIRALQQSQEAKSTWKLAIPGDGYKY